MAVRNASDGHLWLVRVDGFGGVGMNVDLDGDGWLGIDEQACGTDAHDASSTPSDADGDGLCDDVDQVDDEVHPRGSRTIALGDAFGCAITGDVALDSTQPAVVCWGANDEQQVGNATATAASTVSVDAAHGVDLPHGTVVVDLDAGERHACTVTTEGEVFCWGANDHGQLGRDTGHASAFAGLVDLLMACAPSASRPGPTTPAFTTSVATCGVGAPISRANLARTSSQTRTVWSCSIISGTRG